MSSLLLDQRPQTGDPILLHAFARRGRPLTVGDLLRAMSGTGACLSDVMELLAGGLSGGRIAACGFRTDSAGAFVGGLQYELTGDGWDAVEADRQAI